MLPLVLVGRLSFPAGAADAWHNDPILEGDAWPQMGPIFRGIPSGTHATVKDALDAAAALDGHPSFFELDTKSGELAGFFLPAVTAQLQEDIGVSFRGAGRHGVSGWIAFVLIYEQVTCLVHVGDANEPAGSAKKSTKAKKAGKSGKPEKSKKKQTSEAGAGRIEWMENQAFFSDDARAAPFIAVMEFVRRWQADNTLTRAAYLANERSLGLLPLADQPAHAKVMKAVSARAKEVHAALVSSGVKGARDVALSERYADAKAMQTALAAAEPTARAAAVELLALVDPAAAESFAIELLADPSRQARRHAIGALGRMKTARSFDALLRIDTVKLQNEDAYTPQIVAAAVKAHRFDGAAARTLSLLDGDTFRRQTFDGLDRKTDAAARKKIAIRAQHELAFVSDRNGAACASQLLALFDDHPAEEIRVAAATALAKIGGPEVDKREKVIVWASNGMGRALNQDDKRRRELLRIVTEEDSGGIFKFYDLDLATLETLLAERFIHPQARQNDAPSTQDFLEILRQFPEAKVNGYAVSHARADYRVHLEAIACDLGGVPKERHAAIRETFGRLSQNANEVELEGDDLRLWWT